MVKTHFSKDIFSTLLDGTSVIDQQGLVIESADEAYAFLKSYGYDLDIDTDKEKVWSFHKKAVNLLIEKILKEGESLPKEVSDPAELKDITNLLLWSNQKSANKERQKWSCAVLRAMHVFAHQYNDFFYQFSDQIQDQILCDFREHVVNDPVKGVRMGAEDDSKGVWLHKYEVKPFKATNSAVLKLLAKPYSLSINLVDKLGLRFVTKDVYDSFRLIRYLVREHLVCFANVMPDQSRNTLFPTQILFEIIEDLPENAEPEDIDRRLRSAIEGTIFKDVENDRRNAFSAKEFKFIKFIARKLITIDNGGKPFRFFFPFEIQIVDEQAHQESQSGPGAHDEYKKRQLEAARNRLLGEGR